MAVQFPVTPILRERRSTQSGNYVMTAAWQTLYTNSSLYVYRLSQGTIDLTNMAAGDSITIRLSRRINPSGNLIVFDQNTYNGVQPIGNKAIMIDGALDVYGIMVEAQQTLGVLRTLYCEFMEAFR